MQISILLPPDLVSLSSLASYGRAAQAALAAAMEDDMEPVKPGHANKARMLYLTPEVSNALYSRGVPETELASHVAGLLEAWAVKQRQERIKANKPRVSFAGIDGADLRPQQRDMISAIVPALAAGRIVFSEASTGVGKSRALATIAHVRHNQGDTVTIATPTIALMLQLLDEFDALGLPAPAIYLGRQQFVDPQRLAELVDDPDALIPTAERDGLKAWNGAPVPGSSSERMTKRVPGLHWLMDDLIHIAPSVQTHDVALLEGDHAGYDALRAAWEEAPIRITSHAWLAASMRMKQLGHPIVPFFDCLLIDEAHLLEDAVARVFSSAISFFSLRNGLARSLANQAATIRQRRVRAPVKRLLNEATNAIETLSASAAPGQHLLGGAADGEPTDKDRLHRSLTATCRALIPDLRKVVKAQVTMRGVLPEILAACSAIVSNRAPTIVNLSRVRKYPSIMVGPRSLKPAFDGLWDTVGSAALVSGTLCVDTAEVGISAGYFASLLNVPSGRVTETPRIVAPWIYTTPTVFVPHKVQIQSLIPPSFEERPPDAETPEETAYYGALGKIVDHAAASAAGGTLVLCTSYRAVRMLCGHLSLGDRVIEQTADAPFMSFKHAFIANAARRPVWVATGSAWTGLDLRDEIAAAEDDRMLTDLVITRLPIMMANSVHATLRAQRAGMSMMRLDTSFRLRQGIGRLVRAKGQPDRRLWICDGRPWSSKKPYPYLCGPSLRAIDAYPRRIPLSST